MAYKISGQLFYVRFGLLGIMFLSFLSCSGSGTVSGSGNDQYSSQALLGPIVGATVDIYRATDLSLGVLCQTSTVDDPDIDMAGIMNIPADCIRDDGFYLLVTWGGEDIDPNDDGVRDPTPSKVNGQLHALFTKEQIMAGQAKITAVTELAYQYTAYLLSAGYGEMEIEEALSQLATVILTRDINGDGYIDYLDLAAWHPRLHHSLFRPGLKRLKLVAGLILDGFNTHAQAFETILNLTLGVKDDFPEFNQASWIRTDGDVVVIDGRAYRFQPDPTGNIAYEIANENQYDINMFGDHQPMMLNHDVLQIKAHLTVIENTGPNDWEITSPPRIEISNIHTGATLNSMALSGDPTGIKVVDNQLFVLRWSGMNSEPGGLDLIDLSDPENLIQQASVKLTRGGLKWVFRGNEVTVLEPGGGHGDIVHVFDLSSTTGLPEKFSYRTDGTFSELDKMRASENVVLIWNRFHPKSLTLIDRKTNEKRKIDLESEIIDFDINDTNIYALTEVNGLRILEVSLGQSLSINPAIRWTLPIGGLSIDLIDDELWVLKDLIQSSNVVSLMDLESPEIVSEVFGGSDAVKIDDGHVLVCWAGSGMRLYERDITGWRLKESMGSNSWCLERNSEYAFVASSEMINEGGYSYCANGRLDIFHLDMDKLDIPYHRLIFEHDAQFDDLAIGFGNVYLVDSYTDIFQIVDISNPAQAFSKSILKAGGNEIALFGQHAYVASGKNGIRLIDISNPASPQFTSSTPSSDARDLTILNGRLYLADGSGGLKVFDIEQDGSLSYIITVLLSEQVNAVQADGNWVRVSTDSKLYGLSAITRSIP